jgi:CheY-like chemotaxis protein
MYDYFYAKMTPLPSRTPAPPAPGCRILAVCSPDDTALRGQEDRLAGFPLQFCVPEEDSSELTRLLREAVFGLLVATVPASPAAAGALTAALEKAAGPDLHVLLLVDPIDLPLWRDRLNFLGNRLLVMQRALQEIELLQLLPLLVNKRHQELTAALMAGSPAAPTAPPAKAPAKDLILVVDDDETIAQIMTQVLATHHHATLTAPNADEAWRLWCRHRENIRLVITDINMPGGPNGFELARMIQQDAPDMPVVYTSGQRATSLHSSLEAGINYLPKPFGMNDLLHVVQLNLKAPPQP